MKRTAVIISIAILATAGLAGLYGCAEEAKAPATKQGETAITGEAATKTQPVTTTQQMNTEDNAQLAPPVAGDKIAVIDTDLGTIKMKLFTEQVPEMTKNFETLAKDGKYDNVPFHRVITDFMIQTGDFTKKNGMGGYSYKGAGTELPDEIVPSLKNLYGTVAMANHGADTNGSQFFIVTAKEGASFLDGGYTVFGQVYEGMDVAEKIADLYIPSSGQKGTPSKIVNMTKVTVMPYAKP
jgi:cyclophilin family peptidyl-prolyl cis-trans isomerase